MRLVCHGAGCVARREIGPHWPIRRDMVDSGAALVPLAIGSASLPFATSQRMLRVSAKCVSRASPDGHMALYA
jgi:hypothetical protein